MDYKIIRNKIGYYEVENKPSEEDLQRYYQNEYFQHPQGQYQDSYNDADIQFFKNKAIVCMKTMSIYGKKINTLLELGAGEGFFSNHFLESGVQVLVNDISDIGIRRFNPTLLNYFRKGDALDLMRSLASENRQFDLVSLDNVLEHVSDPKAFVNQLRTIMDDETVVRITVPNDFSSFQQLLIDNELATETWVCPPQHLTYFNSSNLVDFFVSQGFHILSNQVDFPIEVFLANENSHYYKNRSLGKAAHSARMMCVNYFVEKNTTAYVKYCELGAELEYGRDTTIYVTL